MLGKYSKFASAGDKAAVRQAAALSLTPAVAAAATDAAPAASAPETGEDAPF
jgi:myo-inositol-1(or 4)-monophosphatase